jgi:hypothetical protein
MLSTIVNASPNAAQLCALVAVILFIIAGVIAFVEKTIWAVLICAGLAFVSACLLWAF